jgi:hypothetical protein
MQNFAMGWLIFTCGEQSFTKGGGFLLGESMVLQKMADFYLGRAGFYKVWRMCTWGEQGFTKGGAWRIFTWRAQNFCLRGQMLGMELEILIRFEWQSSYSFLYCIIINY